MENLKLVGDQSDVPEDYELVESEDIMKFLESDYGELRLLVRKAIKDGTIRLTRKAEFEQKKVTDLRLCDISNQLGSDWVRLARELDIEDVDINLIRSEYPDNLCHQALVMLRLWRNTEENKATENALEKALRECHIHYDRNKMKESVAQTQLNQSGFDAFKGVSYDEQDVFNQDSPEKMSTTITTLAAEATEPWMTYTLYLEDVDIEGREGLDLLHNAVEDGNINKVKLLVEAGANPHKEDIFGVDLLHKAAEYGYLDTVKLLVEAGASPDKKDNCGYSHLHTAAKKRHLEIVKYLHSQGAKIQTQDSEERLTPLWRAAYYGDLPMVEYLANNGADIEEPEAWMSLYPLNAAVYNGHVEVVKFLIEKGADVDKQTGHKQTGHDYGHGLSSLEIALDKFKNYGSKEEEYEAIIKLLKDAGATELNQEAVNELVGDTFRAMYGSGLQKSDHHFFRKNFWPNFDDIDLPECLSKLRIVYNQEGIYRMMMKSFFDIIPFDDPLGPTAIGLLLNNCCTDMEEYLRLLEIKGDESVHRKICLILSVIAHRVRYDRKTSQYNTDNARALITPEMLDYLFGNLQPGTHPETMLYSMLTLESFSDKAQPDKHRKLVNERFSQFPPSEHPVVQIEKKMKDSNEWVEHQLAFCAEWLLDNLWGNDDLEKVRCRRETNGTNVNAKVVYCNSIESKCLKIGQDGLEASCGPAFNLQTVMSTVAVDVGCWYYEVTIFSEGIMQIGWASKQAEFVTPHYGLYGVGDDVFGESFDGCRQLILYNREQKKPTYAEECIKWKSGDVVGALIDIENQEIVISVNGEAVTPEPMKELFKWVTVTDGFFAAVSLMGFQHCQFNFGNVPFKHAPEGRNFKPLNEATSINEAISINHSCFEVK